ncbi:MAG: hypothetical protein K1W24_01515 [Lachnospiraceae bacterium]
MYQVSYDLDNKNKKPKFNLDINGIRLICLYDTGAITAVWCGSKELFEETFPKRELQQSKFSIGGFGGRKRILTDIFRVDGFRMGEIEFPKFPVVT